MDPIDLGLNGARAAVIGAGYLPHRAGHGRGTVLNLARAGATVACIDINEERAKAAAEEVVDQGGKAFPVVGNALDKDDIKRAVDEAAEKMGGLDTVADIVGTAWWSKSHETPAEDIDSALLTNLVQVYYSLQAAIPHLIEGEPRNQSFTAIASISGLHAARYHAAYGAAKAGVIALVKTFADEYGRYGVRVNAVAPGNVGGGNFEDPPAVPGQGDYMEPLAPPRGQNIADGVLFMASSLAARVSGQTLVVDAGFLIRSRAIRNEADLAAMKAAQY